MARLSEATRFDRWVDEFDGWTLEQQQSAVKLLQLTLRRAERAATKPAARPLVDSSGNPQQLLDVTNHVSDIDAAVETARLNLEAKKNG